MQADRRSKQAGKRVLTAEEAFAAEAGITVTQLLDENVMPKSSGTAWRWEYGKPLLPPDEIEGLPTQMHKLHRWYMEVTKTNRIALPMRITNEHFMGVDDEIQIYVEELFQLYKLDALDLSIVCAYCL